MAAHYEANHTQTPYSAMANEPTAPPEKSSLPAEQTINPLPNVPVMVTPTITQLEHPVAVIGPQYILPSPVDLVVVKKVLKISDGNFEVSDLNGNLIFKVKGIFFSIHDRRILYDSADNPLVTFKQKLLSAHRRWYAYRGESTDDKDLLFTVRKSSVLQFKTELDVFLAGNDKAEECDFRIKGTFSQRSCVVYYKDTNAILGQMLVKHNVKSVLLGKDTFGVTVYPNVDYAFIISLIVILNEINEDRNEF